LGDLQAKEGHFIEALDCYREALEAKYR
jgi:hypothetical protein